MKHIIIIFSFFLFLTSTQYAQNNINMTSINSIVKNIEHKYAPDKRTAIFDIKIEKRNNTFILTGSTNIVQAKNLLISSLKNFNMSIKDSIELLPQKKLGKKTFGIIDLSVANLRTQPKHSAELASQVLLGTPILILEQKDGWFRVQTPDKYIAWIEAGSFTPIDKEELTDWQNSKKIIFLKEYGFSYSKPSLNSSHISDLAIGDILKLDGEIKDFYRIHYPDNRIAYVKKDYCKVYDYWLNKAYPTTGNIIRTAKRFMGVPYLWGGTSDKAFDCSGFTKTVYFLNGILLPRDASQQVFVGKPIDTKNGFENLKPGDLLFFGKKDTSNQKEKITHVGIYIGNDEFIHASGRVKINSFNPKSPIFSQYRLKQFVRAKRLITSVGKNNVILLKNNKLYTEGKNDTK